MANIPGSAIYIALIVAALTVAMPVATAQNNAIKPIAPDEALLDFSEVSGDFPFVEAGYVNNKIYVEAWLSNNSQLIYRKLSGRLYFTKSSFGENQTLEQYCGDDVEVNCRDMQLKEHSRRLISLVFRDPSNSVCAAIDYVDEEGRSTGRNARLYGNYIVSAVHCGHSASDPEEILARSADILATAKRKNGRALAKIGHFDLPKLK